MKALSIGRDAGCDIIIHDSTDVISRRHAVLNIVSSGKYTIVDMSKNGTYVNGIRITPNVPVPVTRKDIISFAHVAKLDWNAVPAPAFPMRYVLFGVIGVLLIVGAVIAGLNWKDDNPQPNPAPLVQQQDSIEKKKQIEEKKVKEKQDSIKKENERKQDSIKSDSIKRKTEKKKQIIKKEGKPSKKDSVVSVRPIG